jgi:Transposase DDE domain
LGRQRWVVERTFAWLHNLRRLRTRYERDPELHLAFMLLGCAVICQRPPDRLLARIVVVLAPVLIGQPAPAPQDHRLARHLAERPARVELVGQHLAAMPPVIAEIEDELKPLLGLNVDPTRTAA